MNKLYFFLISLTLPLVLNFCSMEQQKETEEPNPPEFAVTMVSNQYASNQLTEKAVDLFKKFNWGISLEEMKSQWDFEISEITESQGAFYDYYVTAKNEDFYLEFTFYDEGLDKIVIMCDNQAAKSMEIIDYLENVFGRNVQRTDTEAIWTVEDNLISYNQMDTIHIFTFKNTVYEE